MLVSLGSAQVSSGFFIPASKSRNVSGSIRLFLTYAHGMCASSAGSFLADAPSLVFKAEVSGPEAGRPKGASSWAIVPLGWNSSLGGAPQRSSCCLDFPTFAISLLCRRVSAPPPYLIALRRSGGMVPHGAGDGHPVPSTVSQMPFSQFTWVKKNKNQGRGCHPVSFSLVRLLAEQLLGSLLTRDYQTVHRALASTHPLGHS